MIQLTPNGFYSLQSVRLYCSYIQMPAYVFGFVVLTLTYFILMKQWSNSGVVPNPFFLSNVVMLNLRLKPKRPLPPPSRKPRLREKPW